MFGLVFAVVRHAGWWLQWQAGSASASAVRDLADLEPELCESS
jgi:hypothetical protein